MTNTSQIDITNQNLNLNQKPIGRICLVSVIRGYVLAKRYENILWEVMNCSLMTIIPKYWVCFKDFLNLFFKFYLIYSSFLHFTFSHLRVKKNRCVVFANMFKVPWVKESGFWMMSINHKVIIMFIVVKFSRPMKVVFGMMAVGLKLFVLKFPEFKKVVFGILSCLSYVHCFKIPEVLESGFWNDI